MRKPIQHVHCGLHSFFVLKSFALIYGELALQDLETEGVVLPEIPGQRDTSSLSTVFTDLFHYQFGEWKEVLGNVWEFYFLSRTESRIG